MNNININYEVVKSLVSELYQEIIKLADLLTEQDRNFALLNDPTIWYGPSQTECMTKYKELSSKYQEIVNNISNYKVFLDSVNESYKLQDETTNKNVSSLSN